VGSANESDFASEGEGARHQQVVVGCADESDFASEGCGQCPVFMKSLVCLTRVLTVNVFFWIHGFGLLLVLCDFYQKWCC
jgi:hypothetical protein